MNKKSDENLKANKMYKQLIFYVIEKLKSRENNWLILTLDYKGSLNKLIFTESHFKFQYLI